MQRTLCTLALLVATTLTTMPTLVHAQPQRCSDGIDPNNDPRNPDVICLPEVGRWPATLKCIDPSRQTEKFGQQIVPLGDIDGDSLADWIVGRVRCDTSDTYPHYPDEIWLYHGALGHVPVQQSYTRIGPTEVLSSTTLIATGDFDGDSYIDLCCRIDVFGDSTVTNPGYRLATLVVFWGNAQGKYAISDTTRLQCGTERWLGIYPSVAHDFDNDGVTDLVVNTSPFGVSGGVRYDIAPIQLFRGHQGKRWGRDGVPSTADWRWWNPPTFNTLAAVDQDGDGFIDLCLHNNDFPSRLTVLYGKPGGQLPDTTNIDSADLASVGGRTSLLIDLTGDHIPELVLTNSERYLERIYIGLRGQRISQQFGIEAPDANRKHWWGKPWAELWEPAKINAGWPGPYDQLYNLGDLDLDGINDIVSYNAPWLTCYRGGVWMDSLIDAMVDIRACGGQLSTERPSAVAVLGDIDGSHIPTIAVSVDGIVFVKPSKDVPETGVYRKLPDGTGTVGVGQDGGRRAEDGGEELRLVAIPNPATDDVWLRWNSTHVGGNVLLLISDEAGREVHRYTIPAAAQEFLWKTDAAPSGTYLITLVTDHGRTTTTIVRR